MRDPLRATTSFGIMKWFILLRRKRCALLDLLKKVRPFLLRRKFLADDGNRALKAKLSSPSGTRRRRARFQRTSRRCREQRSLELAIDGRADRQDSRGGRYHDALADGSERADVRVILVKLGRPSSPFVQHPVIPWPLGPVGERHVGHGGEHGWLALEVRCLEEWRTSISQSAETVAAYTYEQNPSRPSN